MVNQFKKFLFPTSSNGYSPYVFRRSVLSVILIFFLIINSFSLIFFGGATTASAGGIDVNRLVQLANEERVSRGLGTLTVDSRLVSAAQAKGEDMFAKQYWSHYGPNGETPWQFIKAAGYNYVYAGENLAKDFTSTDPIHTAWMNSPTHRDNIINVNYEDIGIAAVSGVFDGKETYIVVQMFGSQYVAPAPAPEPEPEEEPEPQPTPTPSTPTKPTTPTTPTPAKDTTAPDKPVITNPVNGDIFNTYDVEIKGTAESSSEVKVYDGEEQVGSLTADGGAFTYIYGGVEDGEHVLGATATDSAGNTSNKSDTVTITVDTVAPVINSDSFKLTSWSEKNSVYEFEVNVEGDPQKVSAVLGEYVVDLEKTGESTWKATFSPDLEILESADRAFALVVVDVAGNESRTNLVIPDIDGVDEGIEILPQTGEEEESVWEELKGRIEDFFAQSSPVQKINVFLGILLLILAVIDAVILWRKGIKRKGGQSTSHIAILVLLLIALLFAATGLIL